MGFFAVLSQNSAHLLTIARESTTSRHTDRALLLSLWCVFALEFLFLLEPFEHGRCILKYVCTWKMGRAGWQAAVAGALTKVAEVWPHYSQTRRTAFDNNNENVYTG